MTEVVKYPAHELLTVSLPVEKFDSELVSLVNDMVDTMYTFNGVGLAATQIGVHKRVIVVDTTCGNTANELRVMVNPKITRVSEKTSSEEEGCLSVPGVKLSVSRASSIELEYQDVTGEMHYAFCTGLLARVVQHEVDHLDGILMLARADDQERWMAFKNHSSEQTVRTQ